MPTVTTPPGQGQNNADHRAGVIKTALAVAGGSGGGLTLILGAAAFGAIPAGLAYAAIFVFGVIVVSALIVAAIYITRR